MNLIIRLKLFDFSLYFKKFIYSFILNRLLCCGFLIGCPAWVLYFIIKDFFFFDSQWKLIWIESNYKLYNFSVLLYDELKNYINFIVKEKKQLFHLIYGGKIKKKRNMKGKNKKKIRMKWANMTHTVKYRTSASVNVYLMLLHDILVKLMWV